MGKDLAFSAIVPYGVPQGSLLGPKLFSILANDLPDCIPNGEIHLYADDTTAFVIGKNDNEVVTLLNIVLSKISKCCSINNLTIHPTKWKVILISRKSFTGPLKPVKWQNKYLKYTDKVKVLGIYIDNKVTWKPHIKELTKSFNAQLKYLKRISYLSTKELESIYFKWIIPHINYCVSVWGNCSTSAFEPIEALHVKAARLIHRLLSSLEDHDVPKKVHWQNISNIYKRRLALEMLQIINSDGCHRLSHTFKQVNSVRIGKLIEMNATTSEFGKQSLFFRGPVTWNNLDRDIRNA